jgi:heme exporter protein C
MIAWLYRLGSPRYFYRLSTRLFPYASMIAIILMLIGSVTGLWFAPPDYQQGEGFRIIYVHVPTAFLSLAIYTLIFINSVVFLVWRIKLADIIASACAPIGATYTFIALITGAIWGKPMWGTWWVWDARLTSELILLFLYFGYMGLRSAIRDHQIAAKACAILAIVGMVDIPVIHFSVEWWQTLHQGATLSKFAKPSMSFDMLYPLYLMMMGFGCGFAALLLIRARTELLSRERHTEWVLQLVNEKMGRYPFFKAKDEPAIKNDPKNKR